MNKNVRVSLVLTGILLLMPLLVSSCGDGGLSVGDDTPPAEIEDLSFDSATKLFTWTAPGDDGNSGSATIYFFRFYDEQQVAEILGVDSLDGVPLATIEEAVRENFGDATQVINTIEPGSAGTPESFLAPRLDVFGSKRFFYAVQTNDEVGNSSSPSNVVEVTTSFSPLDFQDGDTESCLGESAGSGNFNPSTDDDVEDNRTDDLVIGDPCLGRVYIFFGGESLITQAAGGVIDVSSADVTIIGNAADMFGAEVAGIGDVEGDFADELAIGAPGFDGGRGQVLIIEGDRDGLPPVIDLTNGAEPNLLINGENAGDNFGFSIIRVSLIYIGAPNAQSSRGRAYQFRGGDIEEVTSADDARTIFTGESPGDMFGFEIINAGFIDDDSSFELAISAPGGGKVYVFFEDESGTKDLSMDISDVTVIEGDSASGFGASIGGGDNIIGPVDDDDDEEIADLVVGAPGSNMEIGSVFLYSGEDIDAAEGSGASPDFVAEFTGLNPGDQFGASIAGLGDIDPVIGSDNQPEATILSVTHTNGDFVVGAPGISQVYLFFGRGDFPAIIGAGEASLTFPLAGDPPAGEEFGGFVLNVGDVTSEPLEESDLNEEFMGLNIDFVIGGAGFIRLEF